MPNAYTRICTRGPRRIPAINQGRSISKRSPIARGANRINLRGGTRMPPRYIRRNTAITRSSAFPAATGTVFNPPALSNHPSPTVELSQGTGAVASITHNTSTAFISRIYTKPPTITITPDEFSGLGLGSGATATVTLTNFGTIESITVTNGGSGYLFPPTITIDAIEEPPFRAPIEQLTNTGGMLQTNGTVSPSQALNSDLLRFYSDGRRYSLHQPEAFFSNLTKRKRHRMKELGQNPTLRLSGAPFINFGLSFPFVTPPTELMMTTFTYHPSVDILASVKKDVGNQWGVCAFEDFLSATEEELLEYMRTFNILDEDFPITSSLDEVTLDSGARIITVIGFVSYNGELQDAEGAQYCIVYCNKFLPSTITSIATLNSDYWVLVTTNEIEAKIICKK